MRKFLVAMLLAVALAAYGCAEDTTVKDTSSDGTLTVWDGSISEGDDILLFNSSWECTTRLLHAPIIDINFILLSFLLLFRLPNILFVFIFIPRERLYFLFYCLLFPFEFFYTSNYLFYFFFTFCVENSKSFFSIF